jgi:hypothetical protein
VHFIRPVSTAAFERVMEDLGLTGEHNEPRAREYLREAHDVAAKREELDNKKKRLDRGLKAVAEFQRGGSM